jgi:hypothetical protein
VRVCHFPPGTSEWNKIEHRMFSFISLNWRGKPLISHDVVVNLIGNTRTATGLSIQAELDTAKYPKGVKVSDEDIGKLNLTRHDSHGEWNYSIAPNCSTSLRTTPYLPLERLGSAAGFGRRQAFVAGLDCRQE